MKKLFNIGMLYTALFLIFIFLFLASAWSGNIVMLLASGSFLAVLTYRVTNCIKEEVNKLENK